MLVFDSYIEEKIPCPDAHISVIGTPCLDLPGQVLAAANIYNLIMYYMMSNPYHAAVSIDVSVLAKDLSASFRISD